MSENLKIQNAVSILPFHFRKETYDKYLKPEFISERTIIGPIHGLPNGLSINFSSNGCVILCVKSFDKNNCPDDIPQDFLNVLDWAVNNKISYIEILPYDGQYVWFDVEASVYMTGLSVYGVSENDF